MIATLILSNKKEVKLDLQPLTDYLNSCLEKEPEKTAEELITMMNVFFGGLAKKTTVNPDQVFDTINLMLRNITPSV